MKITIEIIKDKYLSRSQMTLMNKWRVKEFGLENFKNFKKDYWPGARFFFVKDSGKVVSFGGLRDVRIRYLGKKYSILGICNIISVIKGKGYGKIVIQAMMDYSKRTGKTLLGFCEKKNSKFYGKAGLKIGKDLDRRFILKNPKTDEEKGDKGADGIYYDGKDRLIKKVLSTKGTGYYWLPDVDKGEPHW
jgi:hypothetical protein